MTIAATTTVTTTACLGVISIYFAPALALAT